MTMIIPYDSMNEEGSMDENVWGSFTTVTCLFIS
jgi:hypothetical protein